MYHRNLVANYFGTAWGALLGLAFVPAYLSYLGLDAYGVIGMFVILQSAVGLLDVSISTLLIRELSRYRSNAIGIDDVEALFRAVGRVVAVFFLALATVVLVSSPGIARVFVERWGFIDEHLSIVVSCLGMSIVLRLVEGYFRSGLIGLERQVLLNSIVCLITTFRSAGALAVLAWLCPTLLAFSVWQFVSSALAVVLFGLAFISRMPRGTGRSIHTFRVLQPHWRFIGGLISASGLSVSIVLADRLVLAAVLPLEQFGAYSIAASVAGVLSLVSAPTGQVFYPRISALIAGKHSAETKWVTQYTTQLLAVLVSGIGVTIIIMPDYLVQAWTGRAELVGQLALPIGLLALSASLNCFTVIPYRCRLAAGDTRYWNIVNGLAFAFCIPCYFIVAPKYGVSGTACVGCVMNLCLVLIASPLSLRQLLGIEVWSWLYGIFRPLVGAALVVATLRVLLNGSISSRWGYAALLVASTLAALLCSALLTPNIRSNGFRMMRVLLQSFRSLPGPRN